MSQESLAFEIHVHVRTIRRYENVECEVPHAEMVLIIQALETTYSEITGIPDI